MTIGGEASQITVNAILCTAAFMIEDEIMVQGGVKDSFGASGRPLKVSSIGVAVHLEVSPEDRYMQHILQLSMEDPTGIPVALIGRSPARRIPRYLLETRIHFYGLTPRDRTTLRLQWCTNLRHLSVAEPGRYQLVLSVDNTDARRLPFNVCDTAT